MTQDQAILLCFKVVEVASVVTIAAFVAYYTKVAPWFRNPIGRTIVYKDLALILVLIPSILSIFFRFNRLTSHIAAWFDIGSFALVPIIMCWRIAVWRKIHREGQPELDAPPDQKTQRSDASPLYCSVNVSAPAALTTPPGR